MAAGAVIHTFDVQLADLDRGVYEDLSLRMARHPSETDAFMVTRLLAHCLEYAEGIAFTEGISATDEPAVLVRDATGAITAWIAFMIYEFSVYGLAFDRTRLIVLLCLGLFAATIGRRAGCRPAPPRQQARGSHRRLQPPRPREAAALVGGEEDPPCR